jgi:hypothetical protein
MVTIHGSALMQINNRNGPMWQLTKRKAGMGM